MSPAPSLIDWSRKRSILFDFDGTLVDVVPLFVRICNILAPRYGYTPLTNTELSHLKDLSLRDIVRGRLSLRWWQLWPFAYNARQEYRKYIHTIHFFPGINTLFETLRKHGYSIGIVSSNTTPIISTLLRHHHLSVDYIETGSVFGKSRTLRRCLKTHHLDPDQTLYIGDEVRDVLACQKSGIDILTITWGLNSQSSLAQAGAQTVDTPAELLETLLKVNQSV